MKPFNTSQPKVLFLYIGNILIRHFCDFTVNISITLSVWFLHNAHQVCYSLSQFSAGCIYTHPINASRLNRYYSIYCVPCMHLYVISQAADANRRGEYFQARKHAQTSFWFNLSAIIMFIILMLVGISLGFVFGIAKA